MFEFNACPAAQADLGWTTRLRIRDLVTDNGLPTLKGRRLAGSQITLRGYLGPTTPHGPLALTDQSQAPCQICGGIHADGPKLLLPGEASWPEVVSPREAVEVSAQLVIDVHGEPTLPNADVSALARDDQPLLWPLARGRSSQSTRRQTAQCGRGVHAQENTHPPATGGGPADTILRGGPIHTVSELGTVDAVAIRDGRFIAVGDLVAVNAHAGPETTIFDLDGRTVVPGLIDSHLHQIWLAMNLPAVDLLPARSIADVQARIAQRAADTPAGEWVVASSGWHESILTEGRMPTRFELDEAAPAHPVIVPRGGHVVTVNSAALEAAGITDDTPDPPGGVIVRDADGAATGVLLETAADFARRAAPPPPAPERVADLLIDAMALLNSYGIVGVVDPAVDQRMAEVYKRVHREGRMTVRTDILPKVNGLDDTQEAIAYILAQRNDAMLRFPGLKYMLDGGVEGARLQAPYRIVDGEQPDAEYRGLLLTPPGGREELLAAFTVAADAGLQVQTHGVGDAAIDFIAQLYESVATTHDLKALHWCLMHVFLPGAAALDSLAASGIRLTVQDHPVLLGHNQRRWWGDERAAAAIPIRTLLDAGFDVGGGSDGPVVPVDPFLSMWWMVTRGTLKGYTLGPEHGITAAEALELYTVNNARILGVVDERGSIEVGKRADLAVLSQDLLAVEPAAIRDTRALMTVLDGRVVYRA